MESKVPGSLFTLKIEFSGRFRPILASVSFRRIPWASASKYIAQFRRHDKRGWGPGAEVPGPLFSLNFSFQWCFALF